MKYVIALIILLLSLPLHAEWRFLEKETIHANPLAYPRSPTLGVSVNTSEYEEQRVAYIDALLGGQIGIATLYMGQLALQTSIEAGGWFTLRWGGETAFALLTEDFIFSFPLSLRYEGFSAAVKWNHISAHLGDGMAGLIEDNLGKEEKKDFEFWDGLARQLAGMGLTPIEPFIYSRDFFSLLLSYEYTIRGYQLRSYIHSGYSYKIVPEDFGRWFAGGGTEVKWWPGRHSPYTAVDMTWNQDTNSNDVSAQIGWMLRPLWHSLTLYVTLSGYVGSDRRGQLYGHELQRAGIGLFVR